MTDVVLTGGGLLLTAIPITAPSLLVWAHHFVDNQIHNQLAAERIYLPAANSAAVAAPKFKAVRQYGGQQLTTRGQAEVYARSLHRQVITRRSVAVGLTPSSTPRRKPT